MTCGLCRHWSAYMVQATEGGRGEPTQFGRCRRYPVIVDKPWSEWCGEFMTAADPATLEPQVQTETDDELRERLWATVGHHSVHESRITTAAGAALDEIASFYSIKRQ